MPFAPLPSVPPPDPAPPADVQTLVDMGVLPEQPEPSADPPDDDPPVEEPAATT